MKKKSTSKRGKSVGQRFANAVSFCVDCFSDLGKTKKRAKSKRGKKASRARARA